LLQFRSGSRAEIPNALLPQTMSQASCHPHTRV
jgi:hypothetical protein